MMRAFFMLNRLPLAPLASTSTALPETEPSATVLTSHLQAFIMSITAMMLYCCPPPTFRYSLMSFVGSASSSASSAEQMDCADCETEACQRRPGARGGCWRTESLIGRPTKMIRFWSRCCIRSVD